ncbi:hypothetical protein [Tenacibaculum sp. 190524A02b]|uniref:hypothetical protein n=1 Tax=Tenacibaculum vairaonense TaxID=3137860 RepID=UPI0031FB5F94
MEQQSKQLQSISNIIYSSILECSKELEGDKTISSVKMSGGNLVLEANELVQIQIKITRDEESFIEDFDKVVSNNL